MDKQALLALATDAATRYIADERMRSVAPNQADRQRALDAFASLELDAPIGSEAAIELLASAGSPATMASTGGRYFGFVNGGVLPEALAASTLAGAWDQNVALAAMSPAVAAIDAAAAAGIVEILGLPVHSTAAFCAGASVANLTAIIAARDALLAQQGWDVHEHGLRGAPPLAVVTSTEAHLSVAKALRLAGIGAVDVTAVECDEFGAMRTDRLPAPSGATLVLAQAGNVNTGHSDPFDALADLYGGESSWIHVDGAFGLWANAVPDRRSTVAGVERADSWATDAHKWLNAPYDCGVVICADGRHLKAAMRASAAYASTDGDERNPMSLGLQMSQAARAVPVWAILAARGRDELAAMIEHSCRCAERFAERLSEAGADVLVPVAINQVLVAFDDDVTTDRVVAATQHSGECWMGATTWQGRRAMRISVSDLSTTFDDVDRSVDAIVRVWRSS